MKVEVDREERVTVNVRVRDGARGNYLGGEQVRRTDVEVRVKNLKNGKATANYFGKD